MVYLRCVGAAESGNGCVGMRRHGSGGRRIKLAVRHLPRASLPSVHTVHVRATSKSKSRSSAAKPLRASWTFVVVETPLSVAVRCVQSLEWASERIPPITGDQVYRDGDWLSGDQQPILHKFLSQCYEFLSTYEELTKFSRIFV